MGKTRQEIVKDFGERVMVKQHDHRHLPRTRCVVTFGERLEFILPEGTNPIDFCRGVKTLNPKAHQVVYPQFQADLEEVIVNFDKGMVVFVRPDTKP